MRSPKYEGERNKWTSTELKAFCINANILSEWNSLILFTVRLNIIFVENQKIFRIIKPENN